MRRLNPMLLASLFGVAAGDPHAPPAFPDARPTKKMRTRGAKVSKPSRRHKGPPYNWTQENERRRRQIEKGQLGAENGLHP